MLRGLGIVLASWSTTQNRFKRPGVQLGIERLTADSEKVFEQLMRAREAAHAGAPRLALPQEPPAREIFDARAAGGEDVLPANPLAELSDASLDGFIEEQLREHRSAPIEVAKSRWSPIAALRRLARS